MAELANNRELIESFYTAVGEQDAEHLRELFSDDIEWIHPALGGTFHGVESVIDDVLKPFWEDWDLSIDFDPFVIDGETVVVVAEYYGNYRPTGNQFREPVAHVWDIDQGVITRFQQFVDTQSLLGQIED